VSAVSADAPHVGQETVTVPVDPDTTIGEVAAMLDTPLGVKVVMHVGQAMVWP
jgi:hypothetical protein